MPDPLILDAVERRVLGCLIEKQMSTPDYYPLSLNALKNACNQKNNREPVMELEEEDARQAVDRLRHRGLALVHTGGEHRVPKYGHRVNETLNLQNREVAILAVLLLRGPQTVNELRTRTQSLYRFEDSDGVENTLRRMAEREAGALAELLPKAAGAREPRWMHLLMEAETLQQLREQPALAAAVEVPGSAALRDRVDALEADLRALRDEVAELRRQLGA
jgi:uncharacterized protein